MRRRESLYSDSSKESQRPSRIKLSSKAKLPYLSERFQSGKFSRFKDEKPKSSPQRKITLLILLFTIIAALFFWAKSGFTDLWQTIFRPYTYELIFSTKVNKNYKSKEELTRGIKKLFEKAEGDYAFYVYSLKEGESYGFGQDRVFYAASINKVPIMLAFYKEIEKGTYAEDNEYRLLEKDIQDYGTGSIRYEEEGKVYTYRELLHLAGKQSDNTAAYVLSRTLGVRNVQNFVQALGLRKTSIESNETTAKEAVEFFIKAYRGEILTTEKYREEFFSDLTKTDFEDRIPAGLPEGVEVAHKIGNEEGIYHDCGLVFEPNPYALCIFSEETPEEEALELIPQVSEIIWHFESKKEA